MTSLPSTSILNDNAWSYLLSSIHEYRVDFGVYSGVAYIMLSPVVTRKACTWGMRGVGGFMVGVLVDRGGRV